MGSRPMSLMVMVSATTDLIFFRMDDILRKPVHFWRYSVVMKRFFGTVELTLSDGHREGVDVLGGCDGEEGGNGDVSSCASEV